MTELVNRKKALAVSPLKASQTMGAVLAFLGMKRSMPLMHGSIGCTAFAKVFFVRHFREPVPLQTTAMDQVSSVMGAQDNIVEALRVICEKNDPAIIGLVSTALAETQGCDMRLALHEFREEYTEFKDTAVVTVAAPDFTGSFEGGFASAVKGIVELLPDDKSKVGQRPRQVNVLCSASLTPGDLEFVSESLEAFDLRPLMIPDLSGSLDGHLEDNPLNPLTTGGLSVADLMTANQSVATLVVGESLSAAADSLHARTGVPEHRFGLLMGLDAVDHWLVTLESISGKPVPARYRQHRRQLQDAMLDTHFMLGDSRIALAGDPDLLLGFERLLTGMGAHIVAAVTPARAASLTAHSRLAKIQIGDLEDLETEAAIGRAQLLISNSHALDSAQRLGVPLLRAGFPQYDLIGGFQRLWCGYKGTTQALFDIANLLVGHHQGIAPYHSIYAQKSAEEVAAYASSAGRH